MCRVLLMAMLISFSGTAFGIGLCVKSVRANLRSGPGTQYKTQWTVGRYMPLLLVDKKSSWSKVKDVDGVNHWVFTRLLTQKTKCLVVKTKFANLRTGPGVKFPRAEYRSADRYEAFKRLKNQGAWYYVENDIGERGWIHKSNIWIAKKVSRIKY